jgi:hypothetical protein
MDQSARLDRLVRALVEDGTLQVAIRVPDAVAPIDLEADLRTRLFSTSVEVDAPREGRPKTKVNWIVRQLKDAPEAVRIEARYPNARETTSSSLRDARVKPEKVIYAPDPKREPRSFRLILSKEMGAKRGKGPGSFVRESRQQTVDFYRTIVQQLRPWTAGPPKLPEPVTAATAEASTQPPDFSSTDTRDFGDATKPES